MRIAYLFFAYKNPGLIQKTIQRLACEGCAFFIHIDKKSDLKSFSGIRGSNIFFVEERLQVGWAEFSGVEAILLLMRKAVGSGQAFDYLVLLSGSEYPLRSGDYIRNFLIANQGTEFINLVQLPNLKAGKPMSRITTRRFPTTRPVARFVFRALAKFGLAERDYKKHLGTLKPCGGNTWWTLTRPACEYILKFHDENRRIAKYFENVFAPEEYFIHTVIGNSPFNARRRRSLVFEDWSAGGGHPAMINQTHLQMFRSSQEITLDDVHGSGELLFARKLSDEQLSLTDDIDEIIRAKEAKLTRVADAPRTLKNAGVPADAGGGSRT